MFEELFIFRVGRVYVVVVDEIPPDAEAREFVKRLRERDLVCGPCRVVGLNEMERWGWIRKERANLYADYGY